MENVSTVNRQLAQVNLALSMNVCSTCLYAFDFCRDTGTV